MLKNNERAWIGFIWLRIWEVGGCEHGNGPMDTIKCEEFLDYLTNSWLFKKGSVPCGLQFTVGLFLKYLDPTSITAKSLPRI